MGFKGITVNTDASADAHIFAEDDAAIYQAIFGGDGVMNIGNKFAATVLSNNKVRVSDGVLCVGGHIGRMQYADYTDMTIENGVSGKKRNDIIYAKFVTSGDIDSYVLDVRKGTAGTTAADPAMTQGNLYQGAVLREYPLWRVKIEGLSIVKVEQMFSVIPTIPELQQEMKNGLTEVNSNSLKSKTISVTSDSSGWASITKSSVGIDSVDQIVCIKAVGSVWAIGRRTDPTGGYYRIILLNTDSGNVILATNTKIDLVVYYV